MLKQETLQSKEKRTYEEPDGEFLELIDVGANTLTVLTRVDTEKPAESPINPESFTVSEIGDYIESNDLSEEQTAALLEAEKDGKDRKTAKDEIKETLQ